MINQAEKAKALQAQLVYPISAPVFADADFQADIIGQASTAAEALDLYANYFKGTGQTPTKAVKACPDRRDEGPIDGWVPADFIGA